VGLISNKATTAPLRMIGYCLVGWGKIRGCFIGQIGFHREH
jgi:hypothetical protein